MCLVLIIVLTVCASGLKPGWVIRVNQSCFCLGQVGLALFIKYLVGFCIGSYVLIMASGPDQVNELKVLDNDDRWKCIY